MFTKNFLKNIAKKEDVSFSFLTRQLKNGRVVIPLNKLRKITSPCAVGEGLRIKINTNVGLSTNETDTSAEMKKIDEAIRCGTDTVMDLSVSDNFQQLRDLTANCQVPLGTVPIYEAVIHAKKQGKTFEGLNFENLFEILEKQAAEGIDFFTIHAGILKNNVTQIKRRKRTGGVVSRGGAMLASWISANKKENPFYANFDKILKLCKEYNITISLGDALRPGAIADSTDRAQISELAVLGGLAKRCRKASVQVMVEGPGHIRLDEIGANMILEKKLCHNAPFYVLGPLPIDSAAGYDHITSAIGGAIAASYGADFLCVVTPAEHLSHPGIDDIRKGVIASKIAAKCVNVLRFKKDWEAEKKLSLYRSRRDWDKALPMMLDEKTARAYRKDAESSDDVCSMCGDFCSLKIAESCNLLSES